MLLSCEVKYDHVFASGFRLGHHDPVRVSETRSWRHLTDIICSFSGQFNRKSLLLPLFTFYCSSLYTSQLWRKYKVSSIKKLYAFRMLFRLPRVCSASGMFAVHNVMSCPESLSKLYCSGQ